MSTAAQPPGTSTPVRRSLSPGEWARAVDRARSVLADAPQLMPRRPGPVQPVVYDSWRRSRLQGLSPDRGATIRVRDVDLDSQLVRVVEPIVEKRRAAIEQTACALSLTDHEGHVLRRWTSDRMTALSMDDAGVAPGLSVAEADLGTTSAISMLTNQPVLVRGPEHFLDRFRELSCAGAPIVHPVTRRTVGSLDLTCRFSDTSPFVLSWVMEIAAEVQQALCAASSRRERLLLDAYLAHNRDARHPLVALDQSTVITNAAAARLLGAVDQAMLWEHASHAIRDRSTAPRTLLLGDGTRVQVATSALTDGPAIAGAVLVLKPEQERQPRTRSLDVPELPGLVGRSAAWRALCRDAARVDPAADRLLVVGEAGTGRSAVARALAGPGPVRFADAAAAEADAGRWLQDVETELDGPEETLVLQHVDLLSPATAQATDAALRRRPSGRRVVATATVGPLAPGAPRLLDTFPAVLTVPALRDRGEDLPLLLASLTARLLDDGGVVRWMPDAVQALSGLDWPGNVASLEALVRRMLSRRTGGYIGAADLPADVVAQASRRRLAGLEQAEARTIMQALEDAGGNKHRAAEMLGIARSTLYRKVRALGLDLTATAF